MSANYANHALLEITQEPPGSGAVIMGTVYVTWVARVINNI